MSSFTATVYALALLRTWGTSGPSCAATDALSSDAEAACDCVYGAERAHDDLALVQVLFQTRRHGHDLIETLPVTRFWGNKRFPVRLNAASLKREASPPIPNFLLQFDWMFSAVLEWTTSHDSAECRQKENIREPQAACSDGARIAEPRTVWVQPTQNPEQKHFKKLITTLKNNNVPFHGERVLVCAGDDQVLSKTQVYVKRLRKWFPRIYYYAMDIDVKGVFPMPSGLAELYLRKQPLDSLYSVVAIPSPVKKKEVLGAFGKYFPWLVNEIDSRAKATQFCNDFGHTSWLDCDLIPKVEWFPKLSEFKFMLNPDGKGVQSSKWLEALMAGTIPICQSNAATTSLQKAGWPMVVVDSWEEVANQTNRDKWWMQLSPKLAELRARNAFTTDGYMRYLTAPIFAARHEGMVLAARGASVRAAPSRRLRKLRRLRRARLLDLPHVDDAMAPVE